MRSTLRVRDQAGSSILISGGQARFNPFAGGVLRPDGMVLLARFSEPRSPIHMSTLARMRSVVALVGSAALAGAKSDAAAAPPAAPASAATRNENEVVDPFSMLSGALLITVRNRARNQR